jgi:Xaa-Pro aminopeptidase
MTSAGTSTHWPNIDARELALARRERVWNLMAASGVDHLLLTGFDSIRYVLDARVQLISEGFDWFAAVVGVTRDAELFVPWIDEPSPSVGDDDFVSVTHPLPSWAPASAQIEYWSQAIAASIARRNAKVVGFDACDAVLLEALRKRLPGTEFVSLARELYGARAVKVPAEVALLEAASTVNCQAADAAIAGARDGMTDFDVLAIAMSHLQSAGVEYLTHSLCNVRRPSGSWHAVGETLKEGDAFFFDIGCYGQGGYASDIARVGFIGEPHPAVQRTYLQLLDAQSVGEELAKPGVPANEVHDGVNAYLHRQGLATTPYGIGHGIGLRACEPPTICRQDRTSTEEILEEGMTIAIEPETRVMVDGRDVLLKIEDNYVVTRDGLRRLTTPPRKIPMSGSL